MKHIFAVVLFAVIAGLVAVGVASEKGIHGLSQTVRHALGLPEGGAVVANIKSVGIEGADVSARVARLASETKTKVAEVAEKAIEAAQPDRSKSVTPPSDDQRAEPQVEAQVEREPAAEQAAATEEQQPAAAGAAPVAGVTHFYGSSEGSREGTAVAAWAGAATMNPDYEPADATGETPVAAAAVEPAPAAEPAPEAAAEPAPAPAEDPAVVVAPAAEPDAPAPAAEAQPQAEPEAAPASLGGVGVTSYYGLASKPDADQPWAAAAAANPDYAPASAAEPAVAETAAEPAAAAPAEPVTAAEEPSPPATGTGQTSYYGFAKMPDEDQPWAAPASRNADYTPGEAPAVEAAAPAEQPAAATEPTEPPAAAEPIAAATEPQPAEPAAPAPTRDKGVSSYYGVADKADANQPWAAAAAANPDYTAAVASPPEVTPATQEAVEACRDALNAEAQLGGLTFAVQRWDVTPDNYGSLDKIAKLAKDCGGVVIEVRGHTDNTGRPKSNQTLSDLRAKAVIMYLTRAGVPLSKLKAVGLGEDKPVGDNATVKGRAQNRRIEFVVTPG